MIGGKICLLKTALLAGLSLGLALWVGQVLAEAQESPVVEVVPVPGDMDLRRWPADQFRALYLRAVSDFSAVQGGAQLPLMLDAAELFLSQMLIYEARTMLEGVGPIPDERHELAVRYRALSDAAELLGGVALKAPETSPLLHGARTDAAFWNTLQAIGSENSALLRSSLEPGFAAMANQPKAVLRVALPLFAEAAIEMKQVGVADVALLLLDEIPDFASSPASNYLRGRVAELVGQNNAALEYYLLAAGGFDRFAARARAAVADMALSANSPGALLAAQDLLEKGADSWRGDNVEYEILQRQAEIYIRLNDPREGLLSLGKIIARFPGMPAAAEATEKAVVLLGAAYKDGVSGRMSLGSWVDLHLQILPLFRNFPGFNDYSEMLADKALSLGGTNLAITEYERILAALKISEEVETVKVPRERYLLLLLKIAKAQSLSGKKYEALATIDQMQLPGQGPVRAEVFNLKASLLAAIGQNENFLGVKLDAPVSGNLRDKGRLLVQQEKWPEAIVLYRHLRATFPKAFSAEDATYMLVAALRLKDKKTEAELIASFPGLTQSHALIDLAKGTGQTAPILLPLRLETAMERLDRADQTLERIEKSGF